MTAGDKLLAQDDIDALLGEAGIEGNYESEEPIKKKPEITPKVVSRIRFAKRSDAEVRETLFLLRSKAFLEREDDVKVIWNAQGTVPMVSGSLMKIQDSEYISLGVLYENHLVVKHKEENG